ncbi:MAG: protein-glutamate O-methyltransferase CheR [Lachnotalea sp.]
MITTDLEFFRIVNYVRKNFGINLISKRTLINKRLETILLNYNYQNVEEFMNAVELDKNQKLADILISALVTNYTYFMRERPHYELLTKVIFPKILMNKNSIRIWSAATSSGQEAYSLAMALKEYMEEKDIIHNMEVFGTDISELMLNIAIEGEYTKEQTEYVSDVWKRKYFTKKINGDYKVNSHIKKCIRFEKLNLMSKFEYENKFNIIFLRNVLIYFDSGLVDDIVDKMANSLVSGGYLFIGIKEIIDINSTKLEYIQPSIYRKI